MSKIISLELSDQGIKQAIRELTKYKQDIDRKCEELVRRLSEVGLNVATAKFSAAVYAGINDVTCRVDVSGKTATLYAEGQTVGFIEFGTGVSHPEHPNSQFPHGSYGKGHGKWKQWGYYGEPGDGGRPTGKPGLYLTTGNDPAFAMAGPGSAVEQMAEQVTQIAREVFGS